MNKNDNFEEIFRNHLNIVFHYDRLITLIGVYVYGRILGRVGRVRPFRIFKYIGGETPRLFYCQSPIQMILFKW